MAKDAKGHGSEALHEHRGFTAQKTKGGISVHAPSGAQVSTHRTLVEAKQAMPQYAKGYEYGQKRNDGAKPKVAAVNNRAGISAPKPRKGK